MKLMKLTLFPLTFEYLNINPKLLINSMTKSNRTINLINLTFKNVWVYVLPK
jgi:hypothetical protein